jgi:thioredoxin-dependent peroxiredoxin
MRVGDIVDDFELPDQTSTPRRLSRLVATGPVVLFFYPAAFAPQCTVEHCKFRDTAGEFASVGAQPVGISADTVERQARFTKRFSLGYLILSDVDGAIGRRFDVERDISIPWTRYRRHTYIIGPDRRILDIIRSEFRLTAHANLALQFLRNFTYRATGRAAVPRPLDI